ncbi:hypothetical protein ABI59_18565 [Acidobacteria bacterium Mor1]|nr:hypothetical protein ABI59_18565 [Acidobacteria bacterium Mor1]
MKLSRHVLLCALVLVLLTSAAVADDLGDRIDAAAREQMKSQKLVGLAVGVIENREIVHLQGYGYADLDKQVPVDPRKTMFRWASISKPLTAVAATQLWEVKKLDLDADVRGLVPEFPDKGKTITMRQLLGHFGGIVHYKNGKVIRTRREYDAEHPHADVILALDVFKESPLVSEPGKEMNYTTHGYILASAVVQRAGGEPYHQQVNRRIAEPLGMKTLQPDYPWVDIPDRAVGYRKPKKASKEKTVHWKLGGGGFISTVEDLALFAEGLLDGKLVSDRGYELMWTESSEPGGERTGYGLGFGVGGEGKSRQVAHTGSQNKTRTVMVIFPETGRGVVAMTNSEYAKIQDLARALLGAMGPIE